MTVLWIVLGVVGVLVIAAAAVVALVVYLSYDKIERYLSGQVRARGEHYRGDKKGQWTYYYEAGGKEMEGEYVAGFESGEWSFWHANGRLRARGRLDDGGYKAGEWLYWDEAGRPLGEAEFLARSPDDSLHCWPPRRANQNVAPGAAPDPAGT